MDSIHEKIHFSKVQYNLMKMLTFDMRTIHFYSITLSSFDATDGPVYIVKTVHFLYQDRPV